MNAVYLGDIYSKDDLVKIVAKFNGCITGIVNIINAWEKNRCVQCYARIKSVNYVNKCSAKPDEHLLGDAETYLKKIKKELEIYALYSKRK